MRCVVNFAKKQAGRADGSLFYQQAAQRTYSQNLSQPKGPRHNFPPVVVTALDNIRDIVFGPRLADRKLCQWRIHEILEGRA